MLSDGNVQVPNKIFTDETKDVKRLPNRDYKMIRNANEERKWKTISVKEFGNHQEYFI